MNSQENNPGLFRSLWIVMNKYSGYSLERNVKIAMVLLVVTQLSAYYEEIYLKKSFTWNKKFRQYSEEYEMHKFAEYYTRFRETTTTQQYSKTVFKRLLIKSPQKS